MTSAIRVNIMEACEISGELEHSFNVHVVDIHYDFYDLINKY